MKPFQIVMEPLARIEQELKKCVKCGACRAHCPVFSVLGREPVSARGKIALARAALAGSIGLDSRTRSDMSKCLLCGRCVEKCANDVPTDLIVLAAREAVARKRGLTSFHKVVGLLLRNGGLMGKGALLASLLRPLLFRRVPAASGLRLRFPLPFVGGKRSVPALAAKPFLDRHPEIINGMPGRPRILFFVGCMTNFIYPEIGEAAVTVLKSLGCSLIIPEDQQCCGFPALSGGDTTTFLQLAEKNLAALERHRPDHVMTACASCGGAFHRMYPRLLAGRRPDLAERYRVFSDRFVDAAVLLEQLGFAPGGVRDRRNGRVAYHDPCHLRSRSITREPRALIAASPAVEFVEMKGADSCCGLGGTFNLYHYATSMEINAAKISAIRDAGVDTVATGCPGCMLQLADGLHRSGERVRVRHTLEILASTLNAG